MLYTIEGEKKKKNSFRIGEKEERQRCWTMEQKGTDEKIEPFHSGRGKKKEKSRPLQSQSHFI